MHNLEQTFNISQVTRGHARIELAYCASNIALRLQNSALM